MGCYGGELRRGVESREDAIERGVEPEGVGERQVAPQRRRRRQAAAGNWRRRRPALFPSWQEVEDEVGALFAKSEKFRDLTVN